MRRKIMKVERGSRPFIFCPRVCLLHVVCLTSHQFVTLCDPPSPPPPPITICSQVHLCYAKAGSKNFWHLDVVQWKRSNEEINDYDFSIFFFFFFLLVWDETRWVWDGSEVPYVDLTGRGIARNLMLENYFWCNFILKSLLNWWEDIMLLLV